MSSVFYREVYMDIWPESPHLGQQLFLMAVYCYVLYFAAAKIALGSDILRDVYGSGIIGAVLLPLLGAVPDGIILLVSGLGTSSSGDSSSRITVALGSLVGATVLLSTISLGISIFLGSTSLDSDGLVMSEYRPIAAGSNKFVLKPVLPQGCSLIRNGVNTLNSTPLAAKWLLGSLVTYALIQTPSLFLKSSDEKARDIAFGVALGVCMLIFFAYLYFMWKDADNATLIEARRIQVHKFLEWGKENSQLLGSFDPVSLFQQLDTDQDGALDAEDLYRGLKVLGLDLTHKEARAVLNLIDADGNVSIQLAEFVAFVKEYFLDPDMAALASPRNANNNPIDSNNMNSNSMNYGSTSNYGQEYRDEILENSESMSMDILQTSPPPHLLRRKDSIANGSFPRQRGSLSRSTSVSFPRSSSQVARPSARVGSFIRMGSYIPNANEYDDNTHNINNLLPNNSSAKEANVKDALLGKSPPVYTANTTMLSQQADSDGSTPKYIRREQIINLADTPPVLLYSEVVVDESPITVEEHAQGPPSIPPVVMRKILDWYRNVENETQILLRVGVRLRWALHLWAQRSNLGHISENSTHGRVIRLVKLKKKHVKHTPHGLASKLGQQQKLAPRLDASFPRYCNGSAELLSFARAHADNPLMFMFQKCMDFSAVAYEQDAKKDAMKQVQAGMPGEFDQEDGRIRIVIAPSFEGVTVGGMLLFAKKYNLPVTDKQVKMQFYAHDSNLDRELNVNEFRRLLEELVEEDSDDESFEESQEEAEEEEAHDAHLKGWTENEKKVYGILQLLFGILLILLFSDPVIETIEEIGHSLKIKPFYISFIITPVVANAAELYTAFNFAMARTNVTTSLTINSLLGANVMNNTICVAIFVLLLMIKGLSWHYDAEVITVVLVQLVAVAICLSTVIRRSHAVILILMYPFSIALIYVLENVVGLE